MPCRNAASWAGIREVSRTSQPLLGHSQVRPTDDGRGNGAFAVEPLGAGACLGDYEGDVLDEAAYWQRYPSGVVSEPLLPSDLLPRSLWKCNDRVCKL